MFAKVLGSAFSKASFAQHGHFSHEKSIKLRCKEFHSCSHTPLIISSLCVFCSSTQCHMKSFNSKKNNSFCDIPLCFKCLASLSIKPRCRFVQGGVRKSNDLNEHKLLDIWQRQSPEQQIIHPLILK